MALLYLRQHIHCNGSVAVCMAVRMHDQVVTDCRILTAYASNAWPLTHIPCLRQVSAVQRHSVVVCSTKGPQDLAAKNAQR